MDGGFAKNYLWEKVWRIFEANRNVVENNAMFAVDEAMANLKTGGVSAAVKYLEYAQRLAPSATAISFALGVVRMAAGEPRAVEPLELVADRTSWRDAIMHLAAAHHQFGNIDAAASELHRTLIINAPGKDADFRDFATALADKTGAFGWCGLDNAGRLTLGGALVRGGGRDIAVTLDGRPAPLRSNLRRRGRTATLMLKDGWQGSQLLAVTSRGRPLIGSPIQIQQIIRLEGFVATAADGIAGWCWLPGEREFAPLIEIGSLAASNIRLHRVAELPYCGAGQFPDFAAPRGFSALFNEIEALPGPLEVRSLNGKVLYGSPVDPLGTIASAERAAAAITALFPAHRISSEAPQTPPDETELREPSIPVDIIGRKRPHPNPVLPRPTDIVIPVYRGLKVTMACIESVLAARSLPDERIVVVVDASPDFKLVAKLERLAARGDITLSLQAQNRGFPATANIGLRFAEGRDAILLNSDTLVPPGWATRLQAAIYATDDIGTATPLSNDATIFSYPFADAANPPPDLDEVRSLAALAAEVNGDVGVDVPTGHGFCMYVRRECLDETGVLREDVFGHGYGEENDFCMRARVFGWRHIAVPGLYVGHVGSQSFSATKTHLIQRNLAILNRLHVGYDQLIQGWLAKDPLAAHRRQLDIVRFRASLGQRRSVVLITHDREGGVLRYVNERALGHDAEGDCAIVLRPDRDSSGNSLCRIMTASGESYPNLVFRLPDEATMLKEWLRSIRIRYLEFHHFIGHDETMFEFVRTLGVPYDVFVHDYAWFCPRITLTNGVNRYCGEPPVDTCIACVADHGSNINEDIGPIALRDRSTRFLKSARSIVAPSHDAARRMERQLGVEVMVGLWEPEQPLQLRLIDPMHGARRKLCVVGAIGYEKGYDALLDVARHVARCNLPLELVIVGFTCDDRRLFATGCVTITGRYSESETVDLIRSQNADFGFLPAFWPETWSYTLSQMWEAHLPVVAYDIGAPAERIRASSAGLVVPLHIPVEKLVSLFLHPKLFAPNAAAA
ncbi:MAG: glycosyltransferase [Acidiphilium sp.]